MYARFIWVLPVFLAIHCRGNTIKRADADIPDINLYNDIVLTPEQKRQIKERGFFTPGKWPLVDNKVTVPYYFDNTIPADSVIRKNFKAAAGIYESETCIRWLEVSSTYQQPKLKVYAGNGCNANLGIIGYMDNAMSLGAGCEAVSIIIHEMGHCMGLYHTQSRPDRDKFVRVWYQNIKPEYAFAFDKSNSDTYDVPYDYKSMMHYGNLYFSVNGSYTLTTVDPFALYSIGLYPDTMRYSDSAFLNRAYTCDKIYAQKCPTTNCMNGGFVTQDCKCRCPENTVGARCETVTSPFFSDFPKCRRTITTEGEVTSSIEEATALSRCVFKIEAPNCTLPSITFTYAKFFRQECQANTLMAEISSSYFGMTYCADKDVPIGRPLVADRRQAALYYFTYSYGVNREFGFKADVEFVTDPACLKPGESTSTRTRTTTTPTTTSTTTTPPPVSTCVVTELGGNSFRYSTANYPRNVVPGTKCSYKRTPPKTTDVILTRVNISLQLNFPDSIYMSDAYLGMGYSDNNVNLITYNLWPASLEFKAGPSPGKGFSVTYTPVSGLPTPCNGETVNIAAGETKSIKNPLVGYSSRFVRCAFRIEGPPRRSLNIKAAQLSLAPMEYLLLKPYLPDFEQVSFVSTSGMNTWNNVAIIYYISGRTYGNWEINITVN